MAELLQTLKTKFFDANGNPLVGGKLYSYVAGSTTPLATYTDRGAVTPNTNPVILDANGEANVWVNSSRYYKFVLTDADDVEIFTIDEVKTPAGSGGGGGGVPTGGADGALLAKMSALDGDVDWVQYAYDGYSARFGAAFTSTDLDDTLRKILNITYTAPTISLAASGSGTIREKGASVASTTLTAIVTKRSDPIAEVRFYRNPSTLLDTKTGTIPAGGSENTTYSTAFSDNVTFRAEANDNGATGGPTTVSATASFTFVYPYYVGAGAAGLSAASVGGLTKRIINSTATQNETITAAGGNVFYFAYPASYGALTSILDVNNFETIGDWTLRTQNITGLDATAVSYRIYEFNNPVVAGSYYYSFRR